MERIDTILVPVDHEATTRAALNAAIYMAKALGAKIVLLHVVPFNLTEVPDDLFYGSTSGGGRARTKWTAALSDLAEGLKDAGVLIEQEIREGIAWDEIVGEARRIPAQLIVMGTHGRHGLPRGLLGSVAERVVRTSPVPVVTVRPREAEAAPAR